MSNKITRYFLEVFKPFQYRWYKRVWIAAFFSYIGTWMHSVAAAWLMTTLTSSPALIAFVQTATTLPVVLFAIVGGIMAHRISLPLYIASVQFVMGIIAFALGFMVALHWISPWILLGLTFLLGIGSALLRPAWLSSVPLLVPNPQVLPEALALNSMNFNMARVMGPAIGGLLMQVFSSAVLFFMNAASFLGLVFVFYRMQHSFKSSNSLIAEEKSNFKENFRWMQNNSSFIAILIKTWVFFTGSSALWAFLPIIAKNYLKGGSITYGFLVSFVSLGAILGAVTLRFIRSTCSFRSLFNGAVILFSMVFFMLAEIHHPLLLIPFLIMGGLAWVSVASTLNTLAVEIAPARFRSVALSYYIMTFGGAQALGSFFWGSLASWLSVRQVLWGSAGFLLLGAICTNNKHV